MNKKNKVLLKVRNVKKYFNTSSGVIKAIDDVSFDVRQGEIVGLIGESGSGKTTVGRCLIRLYEEYSGIVNLDGQAVSGYKLNKKKKRFLHKNMQMIFQDPHASLNGQQNIYTILKEPLIVNKIMKNEYKDFFNDWEDIKENFKYTFIEELKQIEVDTISHHVQQANDFLKEWIDQFRKIKFQYNDIENDFNQYFAYKLSIQERDTNIITRMFLNNSKALNLYFKHQKEFRNNSILLIEKKLKDKKNELEKKLKESKISPIELELNNEIKLLEEDLKNLKIEKINIIQNNKNIIASYIMEFKNSYISYLELSRSKDNFKEYNDQIKYFLLSKKMHSMLRKIKNDLLFLTNDEIDDFINSFKQYRDEYITKINENFTSSSDKKYRQELKDEIDKTFIFTFEKYINLSKKESVVINEKINEIEKKILNKKEQKNNNKSNYIEDIDINQLKKEYLQLQEEYELERKEYSISFNKRMEEYNIKIIKEYDILRSIKQEINKLNEEFYKKNEEFLSGLKNHLLYNGKDEKYINDQLNIYKNKIKLKDETLEAFNIEIINLKKDLYRLKHLLGIENSILSKKYIKKILINEKIYKALEDVGLLRQFAWRYPHEFSGGQRQRIVIARALISNPKIIIADEPIASLDVSIQAQVVNILKDLCEKKNVSLIFIAHDLSMVEYIADKILIMHLGKIVEFGKTEEIYSNPKHPYTINLFKSIPKISNANDKFELSNFELKYLDEQRQNNAHVDFFELNDNHIIYSTVDQFYEWTKSIPKISKFSKNPSTLKKIIESKNFN